MALAGLVGVGLDFGLTEAAIKKMAIYWPGQGHQIRRQGQLFIWLRLGLVIAGVTLILMVARPLAAYLLPQPYGAWLIGLALIGVITTTLSGSTNAILQASHKFDSLALTLVSSSALALVMAGGLAISGWLTLTTQLTRIDGRHQFSRLHHRLSFTAPGMGAKQWPPTSATNLAPTTPRSPAPVAVR